MSKIRHTLSVIHYTIRGAVCFQFTHFPCGDWENIYILRLIIIIKSEVWTATYCLGLGHETMVCSVCLSLFYLNCYPRIYSKSSLYFAGYWFLSASRELYVDILVEIWLILNFVGIRKDTRGNLLHHVIYCLVWLVELWCIILCFYFQWRNSYFMMNIYTDMPTFNFRNA